MNFNISKMVYFAQEFVPSSFAHLPCNTLPDYEYIFHVKEERLFGKMLTIQRLCDMLQFSSKVQKNCLALTTEWGFCNPALATGIDR